MYMFQILLREGTTEYGIINMFNGDLQAYLPLGGPDKLGSPDFPLAISFFYGELDWMLEIEDPAASLVLEQNKKIHGSNSNFYKVSKANHAMHTDNPQELSEFIMEDLKTYDSSSIDQSAKS